MATHFKTKLNHSQLENYKEIDGIIDLSSLNIFDTAQAIITVSSYQFRKNPNKKLRYKVSCPNIKSIISDFPLGNMIELV